MDSADRVFPPRGVAIDDTLVGHLEFALRHEGVNLEVIDGLFEHLPPQDLLARLNKAPSGAHIRRACHLWEWLTERELPAAALPAGGYVELFPADDYVAAAQPTNDRRFPVRDNALGTADFSPVVRRAALPSTPYLPELLDKARETLASVTDPSLHERALSCLYRSETRSSFEIEREHPSSDKQERFVQLLRRAGETTQVTEDWLVSLQNAVVCDVLPARKAGLSIRGAWAISGLDA